MNNIEGRLAKFEKELIRTRRLALGAVLLAAGLLVVALVITSCARDVVSPAAEVKAKRFVLVDDLGRTRGMLGADKGMPALVLYGENGKIRAMLGVAEPGSGLFLRDENGRDRAGMSVGEVGPGLILLDENGKPRAMLAAEENIAPRLALMNDAGKEFWATGAPSSR